MQYISAPSFKVKSKSTVQGPGTSDIADLPFGLDPKQSPIIATHFFGFRSVGDGGVIPAESVPVLALGHKIRQGIAIGERPKGAP